jgi:hypothetical protein
VDWSCWDSSSDGDDRNENEQNVSMGIYIQWDYEPSASPMPRSEYKKIKIPHRSIFYSTPGILKKIKK